MLPPKAGQVVDGYTFKGGNPNDQSNWVPVAQSIPKVGQVIDGYTFKGGNPNEQSSWVPVAAPTPEKEKEFGGFLGTLGESVKTLGAADEAAAFAANPSEENRKKLIEATKSKYKSVGFGEGENWEAFKELLGGSLGYIAAPIAAATATGAVTGGIGAVPAAFATNTAQYEVQNLARQAQEQQAAIDRGEKPNPLALGKSLVSAASSAGLDLLQPKAFRAVYAATPFARNLLGASGRAAAKTASEAFEDALKKGTVSFAGKVATGVGKGIAFEIPQEIAQQGLERWQAGLGLNPFTDEGAAEEYKQAALGALVLGGAFGTIGGGIQHVKEARGAMNVTAERERAAEQAALVPPAEAPPPSDAEFEADVAEVNRPDATTVPPNQETMEPYVPSGPIAGGPEPIVPSLVGEPAGGVATGQPADVADVGLGGTGGPAAGPTGGTEAVNGPLAGVPVAEVAPVAGVTPVAEVAPVAEEVPVAPTPRTLSKNQINKDIAAAINEANKLAIDSGTPLGKVPQSVRTDANNIYKANSSITAPEAFAQAVKNAAEKSANEAPIPAVVPPAVVPPTPPTAVVPPALPAAEAPIIPPTPAPIVEEAELPDAPEPTYESVLAEAAEYQKDGILKPALFNRLSDIAKNNKSTPADLQALL